MNQYDTEWSILFAKLGVGDVSTKENFKNRFYTRLIKVLIDPKACSADIAAAYRDALMGAPSEGEKENGLPVLRLAKTDEKVLQAIGLKINLSKQIKLLNSELISDDGLVDLKKIYAFQQVSKIAEYPMDPGLSKLFENDDYKHYKGRAQGTAVRINLKAEDNATTIVNLPTGTGKTLIAHALSLCEKNKLTLVIVPTTALAIDQGKRAEKTLGINGDGCYFWHGSQEQSIHSVIKSKIRGGTQKILFASPEACCKSFCMPLFDAAKNDLIGSIIFDEAHMVVEWGDEFRPYYQLMGALVASLRQESKMGIKTCLMTATLTESTLQVLKDSFSFKDKNININININIAPVEVHGSFLRPEIQYHTHKVQPSSHMAEVLKAICLLPKPLIVYVLYPERAEALKKDIMAMDFNRVGIVTGKTNDQQKQSQLEQWNDNKLDIMVGTAAFGLGVNKDNVRSVLHADLPPNIDSFYQQVGRGGRDGYSAQSMVIWHEGQIEDAKKLNSKRLISLKLGMDKWKEMWGLPSNEDSSKDEVVIDLRAAHIKLKSGYSRDYNEQWNRQVLLSMQRTGMITTSQPVPQPPEYDSTIDTNANKKAVDTYYDSYYRTMNVTTIVDNHQELETWEKLYEPQLEREKRYIAKGFDTLSGWLASPSDNPLCTLLESTYTIVNLPPEKLCNGCPGCRALNLEENVPEVGRQCSVFGFVKQGAWKGKFKGKHPDIYLHYTIGETHSSSKDKFLNKYSTWIRELLEAGVISVIRAEPYVLDKLKDQIHKKGFRGFWMGIDINQKVEDAINWPELILLMPEAKVIPELAFELRFTPKLLVAPDHIISNHNNGTRWWERSAHTSTLNHFIAGTL